MVTLVFIVCTASGCFTNGPPNIFNSVNQCEQAAALILTTNLRRAEAGELEEHTAIYKCIEWGSPT